MTTTRTQVGIIGAGPAGLLLGEMLEREGISSVIIDTRTREDIEQTIRAGILEQSTIDVLDAIVPNHHARTAGYRHEGIELDFDGAGHRIDFEALVGQAVYLYPQHEVLIDLLVAADARNADIRLEVTASDVVDLDTATPRILATTKDGEPLEIVCDFVVGADGTRGISRALVNGARREGHFREYPFAWFGILTEAAPSAPELIYAASERGFALISQRNETVQRMYLQCDPEMPVDAMTDDEIWDEFQARVPATELKRGPIFQRDVLRFRSFVAAKLRNGPMFLVGDSAHTVPPTGAKGMNVAVADVVLLNRALREHYAGGGDAFLDSYEEDALVRIWKAQHFSYWMTSMLHAAPNETSYDHNRRIAELRTVTDSEAGRKFLAEGYTGWQFAGWEPVEK